LIHRHKISRIVNKNTLVNGERKPQLFNVDGEDLEFTNFVKYEVLPGEIEIVTDINRINVA
jgi:diacylglycerol kinase family enzyme